MPRTMPRVAVFSTNFLEYSQTFVHEEVTHHTRYEVEVFARARMNADRFPFEPVHVAGPVYSVTRYAPSFVRRFARHPFALVHGHFGTGALYAVPYARRFGLPLVVTFHGYDVPLLRSLERFRPKHLPYALLKNQLLRTLSLGLCASRELLELLHEAGVPRERLRLYQLGVDLSRFRPRATAPRARVMMVGRFVEKKGFSYGIRAFAAATRDSHHDVELWLVGGGAGEPALRALVAELGIGARTRFTGPIASTEIAALMSDSLALMAPSVVGPDGDRESGVIALKEAAASGCATLGTYHGGIPEIIDDGVTGYLVPERDVARLSAALRRLLDDRELARRLGRAGRDKMGREYDLTARIDALEAHYDEAVALGPRTR
jgi:colanic acid/amylovoran biosynthesis glycosyltransferase